MPLMDHYCFVAVETFYPHRHEASSSLVRVRPLPNQCVDPEIIRVECDKSLLRNTFPVGTVFLLKAQLTDREGTPFIYSYFGWTYVVVTKEEAELLIQDKKVGFYESASFTGFSTLSGVSAMSYRRGKRV